MAEELINALSVIPGLRMAARTSSFQFKGKALDISEIGQRLKVESVLEGSVRKAGRRLRITVQLTNAADGYQMWSGRYDRELDDVFAVQDEIARAIVSKTKVKLARAEQPLVKPHTDDLEAYNLYLQGRYFWTRRYAGFFERAIECFEQAIARDESYALAHAGLAEGYVAMGAYGVRPPTTILGDASREARRALQLDAELAEAHHAMAYVHWLAEWNAAAAEYEFRRAIALNPAAGLAHAFFGLMLAYVGRFDEAIAEVHLGSTLEPMSPLVGLYLAAVLWYVRQYDEALAETERVATFDPGFHSVFWIRAGILSDFGRHAEAIEAAQRAAALSNRQSFFLGALATTYAAAGRRDDAGQTAGELQARAAREYISPLYFADIATALGHFDEAFTWFEQAYQHRTPLLLNVSVRPTYDRLRTDRRFVALLEKIGFWSAAPAV